MMTEEKKMDPMVEEEEGLVDVEHDTSQLPTVEEIKSSPMHSSARPSARRNKWLIVAELVVAIVLVGVIIGVAVGVTSRNNKNDDSGLSEEERNSARFQQVLRYVIDEELSDETDVQTDGTPQNLAAKFMAIDDEAQLEIPHSSSSFQFTQRYALATYYYALKGKSWDFQLNFMSKEDTCQWFDTLRTTTGKRYNFGVLCNGQGQVDRIFMPVINMKGSLPPEVGLLTSLVFLAIPQNPNIVGSLPEEMWELSNLQILDLHRCNLSGTIPRFLGDLKRLTFLALGDNQFTSSIPPSLAELHEKLAFLSLDGNMLTGDINTLDALTNLRFLYLEHNLFEQALDDSMLKSLVSLEQLDLSDNGFSGDLPAHFFEYPAMDVLDLSDNPLGSRLPEFPLNVALNYLFLHGSSLVGSIPPSIGNLEALDHLDLSENGFRGAMPTTMANLTSMIYLFLSQNDFDDGPIPDFVQKMTRIRDLSLKDTNRNGKIPKWITEMDKLLLLDLHRNKLTGTVPTEFGSMTSMALLLLNRNQLEGTIPDELENMSGLAMLLLDNNTITGNTTGVCKARNLQIFITDCGGDNPEVECDCCTSCCDGVTKCNDGGLLARFDPVWEDSYQRRTFEFAADLTFAPGRRPP